MNEGLKIKNISKSFGGVKAVKKFSICLKPGDIISIIGPNGAGKTTIFNLISGIYKIDEGEIFLDEIKLNGKRQWEIAKYGIGRTFQNIRLFESLTVLENIIIPFDARTKYSFLDAVLITNKRRSAEKKVREESMYFLKLLGIEKLRDEKPKNLPYGIQKKVELARALAIKPKILLLDEPTAGLDPSEVVDYNSLIYKLNIDLGLSILLIEHRMEVVMQLSKWIYVLDFGEIIAEGTPENIQKNSKVIQAYMGEEN